ncbi:MAG: S-layer homology domain-containing protein, partial [Candidatus Margulisbacteria bacterium]|nr:S-layer homology domain-containing protein [Candidatus Margulisiibacteriota bacterium]
VKAKGFSLPEPDGGIFLDVTADSWVAPYVAVAVDRQYINGYPDSTFKPNKTITRAEAAAVFARFSGLAIKDEVETRAFPDLAASHWASPAVHVGKNTGFFEFLADKNFEPGSPLTRAEAAEILSKTPFIKKQIKKLISGER